MSELTITSRVIKTDQVKWKEMEFIQQENFKEWFPEGDTKLIRSILKYQFIDPFKVWEHDNKIYCLDGKHRFLDLLEVEKQGYKVPNLLPATFMDCESIEEAAQLVLVYSSVYARITEQGLLDFGEKFNLNISEMPEINLPIFLVDDFKQLDFPDEFTSEAKNNPPTIKITFENSKQLINFKDHLDNWILENNLDNIKYSVSEGEL